MTQAATTQTNIRQSAQPAAVAAALCLLDVGQIDQAAGLGEVAL